MNMRRVVMSAIGMALLMCAVPAAAQEIIQTGPPPELRKNLDAFQKAFNSGSADEYETMAKATFTPEYLKRQTAEQRKAEYTKWHKAFGTIKFERVERNGMDAPLQISVKGSVASGVMWIDLDDATSKLAGVKGDASSRH